MPSGIILYCCLLLISACSAFGQMEKTSYKVEQKGKIKKYSFHVPKGYQLNSWTGGYENEKQYWYPDSSVFYITKEHGLPSINYENIRAVEGANANRMLSDTLTLQGKDKQGLYWKDIKQIGFSYGFSRVPGEKREIFEAIMKEISSH